MGDRMADVVVVTMSEFGRTAHENGNRGTDHGHANQMLVMGGGVKGGKVYGKWPGLEKEQLYEGRDLALTTDFRDVLGGVGERASWATGRRADLPGVSGVGAGWVAAGLASRGRNDSGRLLTPAVPCCQHFAPNRDREGADSPTSATGC